MREEILSILKNSDKALTVYDIQDKLGVNTVEGTKEVIQILHELEEEVVIYHSNKDKYMMLDNSHLRKGVMRANKKGFGFVEVDKMDEDIYVSQDNMNGAIHDDIVLVEITSKMNIDRLEGRVLKIIKRQVERYIGEITFDREPGEILMSIDDGTRFPVMIVEECPAPYYLQWRMPSMGLASWPFEGNVRMGAGLSPMEIRTGEDEQRIVSAEGRTVYDLNSGYVTREEWNYLQTMQYAKEVLLVDVARGVTIPCTVTSATWQTAGNVRHGQHNFPVQLTEKHYTTI